MTFTTDKRVFLKVTALQIVSAAVFVFALLIGFQAPASAQAACAPHAEVTKQLANGHSENPVGIGLANNGAVVEVFSSSDGSSWTIIMTMPNGMSCLVTAGEYWESLPEVRQGPQA